MHYMVMLILDDVDYSADILNAWEQAGVKGVTIMESTGLGRMRRALGMRDDLPIMPNLRALLQIREERHRTFISVVSSEERADALIAAAESVVGDLAGPNKGVIFVLPVVKAVGLASEPFTPTPGT